MKDLRPANEGHFLKFNPTASGFPEACFGVSERIRIFLVPQGRKDYRLLNGVYIRS
jgi:hypothetical protein